MAISKFTPQSAKKDTGRTIGDNEVAKLANLNKLVTEVNNEFANFNPGGGQSFTVTTVGTLGTSLVKWDWNSVVFASPAAGTQTLTPTSYPSITFGGFGGWNGTLSSITISDLTFIELTANSISTLVTVNLPQLTTILSGNMFATLFLQGCSSLTTLNIPALTTLSDSINVNWAGNAFSQATVDHILVKFAATTAINGFLNLSGGTSAAPSATGSAAIATLSSRGWTVLTN
jgi:hypothetical protein